MSGDHSPATPVSRDNGSDESRKSEKTPWTERYKTLVTGVCVVLAAAVGSVCTIAAQELLRDDPDVGPRVKNFPEPDIGPPSPAVTKAQFERWNELPEPIPSPPTD